MKLFPDNFVQNADKAINAIDGFLKKYQELGKTSTNLDTANTDLKKYKANLEEAETKLKSFGNIKTTKQAWEEQRRQVESYEQLKELISVDTLNTMQLLGFNYKAAIGEPLTEICANAISKLGNKTTVSKRK